MRRRDSSQSCSRRPGPCPSPGPSGTNRGACAAPHAPRLRPCTLHHRPSSRHRDGLLAGDGLSCLFAAQRTGDARAASRWWWRPPCLPRPNPPTISRSLALCPLGLGPLSLLSDPKRALARPGACAHVRRKAMYVHTACTTASSVQCPTACTVVPSQAGLR